MIRSGTASSLLGSVLILHVVVGLLVFASLTSVSADEPRLSGDENKDSAAKKTEEAAKHQDAAFKVAEAYLILLDKGKYTESWEASTKDFRDGLPRQKWVDALNKTRRPFGRIRTRKLDRIEMRSSSNSEKMDQAWVYSNLVFQSGLKRSELVVLYFEKAKEWRPSAYFLGEPENLPKPTPSEEESMKSEDKGSVDEEKTEKKSTSKAKKSSEKPKS